MICDVCGRRNAENLTFCQDCGRQLKGRQPRGVAPTPPHGLPKIALPSIEDPTDPLDSPALAPTTDSAAAAFKAPPLTPSPSKIAPVIGPPPSSRAPITPQTPSSIAFARSRPEAPVFSFGPLIAPDVLAADADLDDEPEGLCDTCQTQNPPGFRFCVTCGAQLRRPAPAPESRPGVDDNAPLDPPLNSYKESSEPPAPMPAMPAPAALPRGLGPVTPSAHEFDDKIIGSPVVAIAAANKAPAKLVTCARCHGQSVAGQRFCKYCGAPLDDAPARPAGTAARARDPRNQAAAPAPGLLLKSPPAHPSVAVAVALDPSPDVHESPPISPSPRSYEPLGGPRPRANDETPAIPYARASAAGPARPAAAAAGASMSQADRARGPAPTLPRIVSITEDGSEGKSYPLEERQVDIGRAEGDILLPDDPYVSPRHARLLLESGRWILRDLNSTNRIYLRLKKAYPLRDGDLLLLGLEVLQFQLVGDAERGLGHAVQHGTLLFGSPATPRRARLCQKTVEGVIRDVYHLHKDETVIGRETADIVFSADPFLSRRHAMIRRNPANGEFSASDLDSSNGTYIAIRGDVTLTNGDFVRIGQHLFRLDAA